MFKRDAFPVMFKHDALNFSLMFKRDALHLFAFRLRQLRAASVAAEFILFLFHLFTYLENYS